MIRLCRPAMEEPVGYPGDDTGSAVSNTMERLRVLEEKLLSDEDLLEKKLRSVSFSAAYAAEPQAVRIDKEQDGDPNGRDRAGDRRGTPVKDLPAAVPDDIRKIVKDWDKLLAGMPAGYLKPLLRRARPRSLPSIRARSISAR